MPRHRLYGAEPSVLWRQFLLDYSRSACSVVVSGICFSNKVPPGARSTIDKLIPAGYRLSNATWLTANFNLGTGRLSELIIYPAAARRLAVQESSANDRVVPSTRVSVAGEARGLSVATPSRWRGRNGGPFCHRKLVNTGGFRCHSPNRSSDRLSGEFLSLSSGERYY